MGNIIIKNMSFQYNNMLDPLFYNVNLNISDDWKLGLIGRNGRGKTSFLKILLNELNYEGKVHSSVNFKYFPNYPLIDREITTLDFLLEKNPTIDLWIILKEMNLMGLSDDLLYQSFYSLSGGEQTKFLLLELFLDKNSFPLIDEPTNNLDLSGRKLVAEYLNSKKGYIVISHDYNFLNSFIDHTLSLNRNNIDLIKGDIETWKYEKNNYDNLTLEKNKKLKDEISRLEKVSRTVSDWGEQKERTSKDAFDKKKAAKHMKRSKAILKRTEEKIEQKKRLIHNIETTKDIDINMETARHQILKLRNFSLYRDGKKLFHPINIDLYPKDRLFLMGDNGVGKTSLLNFILNKESFEYEGEAYINLPSNISIIEQNIKNTFNYAKIISTFNKEELEKFFNILYKLGVDKNKFKNNSRWSSGEDKKILIAQELLSLNSLLIWDEITNYLDLLVIQQIINMIQNFSPTMISIDHDEHYVEEVATKTIKLVKYENN